MSDEPRRAHVREISDDQEGFVDFNLRKRRRLAWFERDDIGDLEIAAHNFMKGDASLEVGVGDRWVVGAPAALANRRARLPRGRKASASTIAS